MAKLVVENHLSYSLIGDDLADNVEANHLDKMAHKHPVTVSFRMDFWQHKNKVNSKKITTLSQYDGQQLRRGIYLETRIAHTCVAIQGAFEGKHVEGANKSLN
ncbi:uncharacterized protein PHALS_03845 [Plasmopara halstedii]|uniref:Uncharacterized protein n=1 Tax=Plasmopara halstedii TaxID=4781 RepID=A0A0P1B0B2_PLAHL|nr:uncharacterized protein PHALS_03845 [Plasmopara halstedii]CEG47196.1 hypothetical protein PHALS_03845 [Plasmopara halstedii]|eukprot:XP_024583565.1 hypothetical protein PHALS_03845 [Plasmopara halstedii]